MPIQSAADLLGALRTHPLIQAAQMQNVARELETAGKNLDARGLARKLIELGFLTPYQVNQLLQDRGKELLLGSYVLLERLGEGGMGQVFKARHRGLDRIVALKVIRKDRLDSPRAVKRFHREIEAAACLNHPNIVLAYDADHVGDLHFLTMEYVEGVDLARRVKEKGPLPVAVASDYIRQSALGLQHAFERGLVHRDIKPHNLLLTRSPAGEDVVKILDMGLARLERPDSDDSGESSSSTLTKEGSLLGTIDYIAPEQAMDSRTADIRADLYSLGCTFYYLLTGRVVFPGGDALAKLMKHKLQEPEPLEKYRQDVPRDVSNVIRKLLAKDPHDRYQTPAELAAALGGRPAAAVVASPRPAMPFASPVGAEDTIADGNTPSEARIGDLAARKRGVILFVAVAALAAAIVTLLGIVVVVVMSRRSSTVARPDPPSKQKPARPAEPEKSQENSIGMKLVYIPPGKFLMGSSAADIERFYKKEPHGFEPEGGAGSEGPQHEVRISRGFYLGIHEVTQKQYETVMGNNPSMFKGNPQHPVEQVRWDEAMEFCKKLSGLPEEKSAGRVYRLPTDAEWEYACRAGKTTAFHEGDVLSSKQANFIGTNPLAGAEAGPNLAKTAAVGSYAPNAWGLYDMHGNVFEWCLDGARSYTPATVSDPRGADDPKGSHILRGGAWAHSGWYSRSALRVNFPLEPRNEDVGFRVLLERRD